MRGLPWDSDNPGDHLVIVANVRALLTQMKATAGGEPPDVADVVDWHARLYAGCTVPVPGYVGHFRGDDEIPELVGYEVGVGPTMTDGLPERVGVWSTQVLDEVSEFMRGFGRAAAYVDDAIGGSGPTTSDDLGLVVDLAAVAHGDWLRIHPFANGNGRTARVWAAWVALRYGLPVFVSVKPRPDGLVYLRAAASSMGRPPAFTGDHRPTAAVFAGMLNAALG
jgi:hypothetical protein